MNNVNEEEHFDAETDDKENETEQASEEQNDGANGGDAAACEAASDGVTSENDESDSEESAPCSKEGAKEEGLSAENASLKDQLLRLAADFDNYRKRMIKEKADAIEYANENLLLDLLDSLDNLDRTLQAAGKQDVKADGEENPSSETDGGGGSLQAAKAITDGVRMTRDSMVKMLEEKYGLASYGAAGEEFNADCHQALHSEADADGSVKVPTIKEVYQKGYKLRGKVIRHAKVMVVTPAEK